MKWCEQEQTCSCRSLLRCSPNVKELDLFGLVLFASHLLCVKINMYLPTTHVVSIPLPQVRFWQTLRKHRGNICSTSVFQTSVASIYSLMSTRFNINPTASMSVALTCPDSWILRKFAKPWPQQHTQSKQPLHKQLYYLFSVQRKGNENHVRKIFDF